jgi:DNA invertase Pin-like site-specific DNA recombinase
VDRHPAGARRFTPSLQAPWMIGIFRFLCLVIRAQRQSVRLARPQLDVRDAPAGKALFQMMGVFAEFERAMIQERVHAGLARARAEGKSLGRPTVGEEREAAIRACLAQGFGLIKTAKQIGVGVSVVQRVRAMTAAGGSGEH